MRKLVSVLLWLLNFFPFDPSILPSIMFSSRSQWPRGLSRENADARLLGLWFRIPPGARKPVPYGCCVLSVRGLCVELITRPEEPYRVWCV
jgi:hypothetical protein